MTQQAQRYGVEILQAVAVSSLQRVEPFVSVALSTGAHLHAPAVIVATGSTYRRTGAEGESDLIGAGIHFCATCDGPFYKGASDLSVIGGGNSGLEEGLFLTQFAQHVTVIQALSNLTANKLLVEKVLAHPKMSVLLDSTVQQFNADASGKLNSIAINHNGVITNHLTAGAFVFIGLDPNTEFLAGALESDARGFLNTNANFETSLAGVYAAGDVRAGSTKQLASAVGEGAAVAIQIRYYLDRVADSLSV